MKCLDCGRKGNATEAIGICHHCSAGVCDIHGTLVSDPVTVPAVVMGRRVLPQRARLLFCNHCLAALRATRRSRSQRRLEGRRTGMVQPWLRGRNSFEFAFRPPESTANRAVPHASTYAQSKVSLGDSTARRTAMVISVWDSAEDIKNSDNDRFYYPDVIARLVSCCEGFSSMSHQQEVLVSKFANPYELVRTIEVRAVLVIVLKNHRTGPRSVWSLQFPILQRSIWGQAKRVAYDEL